MAIRPYLAMTAEEIAQNPTFYQKSALIYCPFSEATLSIPGSEILILTDSNPVNLQFADDCICRISSKRPPMVIVDFQRPELPAAVRFIRMLLDRLPCPVYVSDLYASDFSCPVFLSPLPPYKKLADHIQPWIGRDICLDISTERSQIRVTEEGSAITRLPPSQDTGNGFADSCLHCHYSISASDDTAVFTLWRTEEDLTALLDEAEGLGIRHTIGLYQELG